MPNFSNNANFNLYQAINLKIQNLASDPAFSSAEGGRLWFNGTLKYNNGSNIFSVRDTSVQIVNGDLAGGIALSKLATDPLARANHTGTQTASTISDFNSAAVAANSTALSNQSATDRARANHTGTQTAATISDLQTTVQTYSLSSFATPTTSVSWNSQRLTNLADPVSAQDATTKNYVDNAIQGLDPKGSVRVSSGTSNINLASPGAVIDGVTLSNGDRVLVRSQTTASQNGIYVFNGSSAAMTRALDMDSWAEVPGSYVPVEEGSEADTFWLSTANQGGTLGTTAITWSPFGSGTSYSAGTGLALSGNVFSIANGGVNTTQLADFAVTSAKLGTSSVDLASSKVTGTLPIANGGTGATTAAAARTSLGAVGKYSSATHAAGTTITIAPGTHNLGAGRDKTVTVLTESTGEVTLPDVTIASDGTVTVTFGVSQSANTIRVTVVG